MLSPLPNDPKGKIVSLNLCKGLTHTAKLKTYGFEEAKTVNDPPNVLEDSPGSECNISKTGTTDEECCTMANPKEVTC